MFSNSMYECHAYNQICVGVQSDPGNLIALKPLTKKKKIFNCKINVSTGFLDPGNMGKDAKIDFLSQILRKLSGIEYLALALAQAAIIFFACMTEKLLKGAGMELF